jgi:hypothetical protein
VTGVGAGACTHALPHTPDVRARARAHSLHLLHVHNRVQTACTACKLSKNTALMLGLLPIIAYHSALSRWPERLTSCKCGIHNR